MNITKEEVQQVLDAFCADPHTADWDDAITLLQSKLTSPQPRSPSPASADPQDQASPTVLASFL